MFVFLVVIATVLAVLERIFYRQVEDIEFSWNTRYGSGDDSALPIPFTVDSNPKLLPELYRRLDEYLSKESNLLDDENDFTRGMNPKKLRKLVDEWRYRYNWKERAEYMNSVGPQFHISVNGLRIHYYQISVEKNSDASIPILLLHGWPGSVIEFFPLIERFKADPTLAKSYDLVVPSLPSYGFSDAPPAHQSFTFLEAAVIFAKMMKRLYPNKKYICQGGDYGSFICSALAQIDTRRAMGIHLNMATVMVPPWTVGGLSLWPVIALFPYFMSTDNRERLGPNLMDWGLRQIQNTGYFHEQATFPETIGVGLDESPVFLLSWIGEKFFLWSHHFDDIGVQSLLDNVMLYWVTKTGSSSVRWYYYMARSTRGALYSLLAPVPVKTALLDAPKELYRPPTFFLKGHRYPNLVRFTKVDRGGHFLAMEQPSIVLSDLDAFIRNIDNVTFQA